MNNADLPAMPLATSDHAYALLNNEINGKQTAGLTKREEISARFMAVWIPLYAGEGFNHNEVARIAIDSANALIEEGDK